MHLIKIVYFQYYVEKAANEAMIFSKKKCRWKTKASLLRFIVESGMVRVCRFVVVRLVMDFYKFMIYIAKACEIQCPGCQLNCRSCHLYVTDCPSIVQMNAVPYNNKAFPNAFRWMAIWIIFQLKTTISCMWKMLHIDENVSNYYIPFIRRLCVCVCADVFVGLSMVCIV